MRTINCLRLAIPAALAGFLGCRSDETTDLARQPFKHVVEIPAGSLNSAPTYRALPHLRIGEIGRGQDNREMSRIADIAVDGAGSIYVLDAGQPRLIRVFSKNGDPIRLIGEPGTGPKSLNSVRSISLSGDTVVTLSATNLTFFSTNGDVLSSKRVPLGVGLRYVRATSNGIILIGKTRPLGDPMRWLDTLRVFSTTADPQSPILMTARTLFVYPRARYGVGLAGPPLLGVVPQWTISRDGSLFITDPDSFAIHVRDANSATRKTIVSRIAPVQTTSEDLEDYRSAFQREIEIVNRQSPEAEPFKLRIRGHQQKYRPYLGGTYPSTIAVSSTGFVIVQRFDKSKRPYNPRAQGATSDWLIVSPQSHAVGRFSLPGRVSPLAFEGCVIYGTEAGDYDEPLLVTYRLESDPASRPESTFCR